MQLKMFDMRMCLKQSYVYKSTDCPRFLKIVQWLSFVLNTFCKVLVAVFRFFCIQEDIVTQKRQFSKKLTLTDDIKFQNCGNIYTQKGQFLLKLADDKNYQNCGKISSNKRKKRNFDFQLLCPNVFSFL